AFALPLQQRVEASRAALTTSRVVERLWAKDYRLWRPEPTEIIDRLGWLTVIGEMQEQAASLTSFAKSVRERSIKDVVLLGMGGSSLGPEVLQASFGSSKGYPRLWVLDSTVPGWVRLVTKAIDPAKTLFIVASKSGGTIEVMSLLAHFWELTQKRSGNHVGEQFIAITDPGTSLEKLAAERQFWRIFTNPSDIGGRYSVLSYFGLVPASLLGIDIGKLLARAAEMAQRCRLQTPIEQNPGADLGNTMAALAQAGRDKVSIMASPAITSFGLWAEQLLAESTGKEGKGLIPVAEEPIAPASAYGQDRFFVYLRLAGDRNQQLDRQTTSLIRLGHPVMMLNLRDSYDLGSEFFRWEYATAVAGHLLGIHPFDQPNVQESKNNTNRVLSQLQATGSLPKQTSVTPAQTATQLKRLCRAGTYVAMLVFATPSAKLERALRSVRKTLISVYHVTTTAGYGPRYLHSTGQLHKGGPSRNVFLQLIERMHPDVPIPGKALTFGTLAQAQAAGDFEALRAHHRDVLVISLGLRPVATLNSLRRSLSPSRTVRRATGTSKRRPPSRKK
ncbi:MAG TPA: glucose-6-phosphate isomerase, partial [Nitrospira sp.]|nr:glucose-6-phosphate isomerase [Nitrospira sp.]